MNRIRLHALAAALGSLAMSACYVLPIGPDGQPVYPVPYPPLTSAAPPPAPLSSVLVARLYPMNEVASQTGVLSGSITVTPGGKGHFALQYRGDTLTGEATRVSSDDRRGVASAYGPGGLSMTCEYQMMHARQGAGTCSLSNGARYQVHIGG